jgi:hypothetical protein
VLRAGEDAPPVYALTILTILRILGRTEAEHPFFDEKPTTEVLSE